MPAMAQRGFTLVEMVITILIAAILTVGIVNYIGDSVAGFSSSANRNRLASSGRTVLDRMALELHNAVPNSVRTRAVANQQCLEFIPFAGATSYIDPAFSAPASDTFEMIVMNPAIVFPPHDPLLEPPRKPLYAVIYPIDTDDLYLDAEQASSPGMISEIAAIESNIGQPGQMTVTLQDDHRFRVRSPVNRIYIASQPVSFCMLGNRIFRYSDYGFHAQQPVPQSQCPLGSGIACLPETSPGRQLITDRVVNSGAAAFDMIAPSLRRNSLVSLRLTFEDQGDVLELKHEVLLRNVP